MIPITVAAPNPPPPRPSSPRSTVPSATAESSGDTDETDEVVGPSAATPCDTIDPAVSIVGSLVVVPTAVPTSATSVVLDEVGVAGPEAAFTVVFGAAIAIGTSLAALVAEGCGTVTVVVGAEVAGGVAGGAAVVGVGVGGGGGLAAVPQSARFNGLAG
jgi:hypothetical protein